jgi:hypothetical protein
MSEEESFYDGCCYSRSSIDESQNANSCRENTRTWGMKNRFRTDLLDVCSSVEKGRNANSTQRTQTRTLRMLLLLVVIFPSCLCGKTMYVLRQSRNANPTPENTRTLAKPFLIKGN